MEKTERNYQREVEMNAADFVLLSDYVPAVIQEIRYYSTYNFVGDRIDGYEQPCAILTKEAARALKEISNKLNVMGYRIKVFDAYRPATAVRHFTLWGVDDLDLRMKPFFYPDLEKQELFRRGYIASKSSHSRGSTIDLTLLDMKTGRDLDMGGNYDYLGGRSHPSFRGDLTPEQLENRMILRRAMLSHGFKPLETEWWHFTLGNEPYPSTYFDFPVRIEY